MTCRVSKSDSNLNAAAITTNCKGAIAVGFWRAKRAKCVIHNICLGPLHTVPLGGGLRSLEGNNGDEITEPLTLGLHGGAAGTQTVYTNYIAYHKSSVLYFWLGLQQRTRIWKNNWNKVGMACCYSKTVRKKLQNGKWKQMGNMMKGRINCIFVQTLCCASQDSIQPPKTPSKGAKGVSSDETKSAYLAGYHLKTRLGHIWTWAVSILTFSAISHWSWSLHQYWTF